MRPSTAARKFCPGLPAEKPAACRLIWSPGGAQACSLGRKPQEIGRGRTSSPGGAAAIHVGAFELRTPPSPLRGLRWWGGSRPGAAPQATCHRPCGAEPRRHATRTELERRCTRLKTFILALLILAGGAGLRPGRAAPPPETPGALEATTIPPRQPGAPTGSEFGRRTAGLRGLERQRAARVELLAGNVPGFLRRLAPVTLTREIDGATVEAVVWVMPDYLAIGSDEDFLRMPLTHPSAAAVLPPLGFVLPTTRIVDAVFEQAPHHLEPAPLPPGPKMRSIEYYFRHRRLIESQSADVPHGELVAGHKKDVVLTQRLTSKPNRIAIYGWHRPSGRPIQPLSTVHAARYADYSHGVRPVWATVRVDGEERSIYDVLSDPALAPLLSDEGPIPAARRLMSAEAARKPAKRPATD